jgi:hypothetical protein
MDLYILDENFIYFLSYIDCTRIFLIRIDMCQIDICVFIEKHKSKTLDMTHK